MIYLFMLLFSLTIFKVLSPEKNSRSDKQQNKNTVSRTTFATMAASIPFLFTSGLRYNVGTDYFYTYYSGFYRIMDGSKIDGFEVGYLWLNKLIQAFTGNVFWIFFITSALFVLVTFYAISQLSVNVSFSIILLLILRFFFISMNGIRQFIALALLLLSVKSILESKFTNFLLLVILASLFHSSSVLFLAAYWLSKYKIKRTQLLIMIILIVTCFQVIIPLFITLLPGTKYLTLSNKYSASGIGFTIFQLTFNGCLLWLYSKVKIRHSITFNLFYNLQALSFIICFTLPLYPLMERILWLTSFVQIISIPYFFNQSTKNNKLIFVSLLIVMSVFTIYDIGIARDHNVIPYDSIFGKSAIKNSFWSRY